MSETILYDFTHTLSFIDITKVQNLLENSKRFNTFNIIFYEIILSKGVAVLGFIG